MTKLTKKLFISIMTLVLVVMALGTSTFAWFSMNTTVSASGMQVGVKSDATYLLVGSSNTAAAIQGSPATTIALTVTNQEAIVLPSKPLVSTEIGSGKLFETGNALTAATANDASRWYTASSTDPAQAVTNVKGQHVLQSSDSAASYYFDNYVITRTLYLTLSLGSNDAHNLTVTPTIQTAGVASTDTEVVTGKTYYTRTGSGTVADPYVFTAVTSPTGNPSTSSYYEQIDISAVRVLVVTTTADQTPVYNMATLSTSENGVAQSLHGTDFNVTPDDVVKVDIYIYYDGSANAVYSNNAANLANAIIDLQFDVEIGSAN